MIKCELCRKECKDRRGLSRHIQLLHKITNLQQYFDKYLEGPKRCPTCGKITRFQGLTQGYRNYCNDMNCISNDPSIKDKKESTSIARYGCKTSLQSNKVKEKIKATCIRRYGVDNPSKDESVKKKKLNTSILNYGCHQSQSDEIKSKKRLTCFEHFRVGVPSQNKTIMKKQVSTFKEHIRKDPNFLQSISDKRKRVCLEKYGAEHFSKTTEFRRCRRIEAFQRIQDQENNNEPIFPCIGKHERICLNKLQKLTDHIIDKNIQKLGFFPDGLISDLNLIIEFDEYHHFDVNGEYLDKDMTRQKELEDNGFSFFRISQKEWFQDSIKVMEKFKERLLECQKN